MEEQIIIELDRADILQQKLAKLTPWQRFVVCAYLLGWPLSEIAQRIGYTKQTISADFVEAKKRMGVYWQLGATNVQQT